MNVFFLHNHYLPPEIKKGTWHIESVIVPEFYPDLNNVYLDDPCFFISVNAYIKYVIQQQYYTENTVFAIENVRIIDPSHIHKTLLEYKTLGVKIIQLYCGQNNAYFCKGEGLTLNGKHLLSEIIDMDFILDLSHIPDEPLIAIADSFPGKMIVSHCACSDLYVSGKSRSNSLTGNTINRLKDRIEMFGISFLNDIIASEENSFNSKQIFNDIISQIRLFIDLAEINKVALAPDYLDVNHFSKRFQTNLLFPDMLLKQDGLFMLYNELQQFLSPDNINKIFSGNVTRLVGFL